MSWPLSEPSRLSLKYGLLAGAWIVSSDFLLQSSHEHGAASLFWSVTKGLAFVVVTAAILHLLAARMQRRIRETEDARREELRKANEHLQRSKRMFAALARANQATLAAKNEESLFREISEAMVGLAGLSFVWFAWANERTREVTITDWSGNAEDYARQMRCSLDPADPHGQGPTGRAIREQRTIVVPDMLTDPSLSPWREGIQRHGFRPCISIPLTVETRRGAIVAYAGEPNYFDAECVELMHRLVADLIHGLGLIRARVEREQLNRDLLESQARHRALFDNAHTGLLLINPHDHRVADATPAAARLLGIPRAELLATPLSAHPAWNGHGLSEAARQSARDNIAVTVAVALPAPDVPALRLSATFSPFPFRDDTRLLCTLEDVTEQHRSDEQLKLMRTMVEAAPTGIIVADVLGRIQWVNPAFTTMTGYTLAEVVGRSPGILKSGRQNSAFYEKLWTTISRGKVWEGDLQNQRRDGSLYWEHMLIAPVMRPNGTIEHYVAIQQDITAHKEMETQVARTQRLESIGLLAGGIAHDLNNVLAPILMAMDLFKIHYPKPADQARFEMVRQSAQRGAGIVRQVLTFARGVGGERMSLQASHLIKEIRNLLRETLPKNIELSVKLPDDLRPLVGDPTQLHQVLLNLCVNARDAMPDGGHLTIEAAPRAIAEELITLSGLVIPPGDYVAISVADTGTGIPQDILDRIFEPFFTTKSRGAGTGLGLSTVLGIVRGHGGGLDVQSTPDKGTRFCVILPTDLNAPGTQTPFPPSPEIHGAGRAVLVVDDEEPIRALTKMALETKGFTSVTAADGQKALAIFERDPDRFSAIILDHMMPRLGGAEVAARIKQLRPALPIVFISGLLAEESPSPANAATDAVLRKPFAPADLYDALARVLPPAP